MPFRNVVTTLQNRFLYFLGLSVFFAFFYLTVWGENGILRLAELKRVKRDVEAKNQALLSENLVHVQKIERMHEPRFIEQEARSRMGLVSPDETVFVMPAARQ